jgi:hypothetical protein
VAMYKTLIVSLDDRGLHRPEIGLSTLSRLGPRAGPGPGSTDNVRVRADLWPD